MIAPELLPSTGEDTSIKDRRGVSILDGSRVLSFNIFADGESYQDIKAGRAVKIGVPCVVRRMRDTDGREQWLTIVESDGSSTGCGGSEDRLLEVIE
jgi:hypothetical protein